MVVVALLVVSVVGIFNGEEKETNVTAFDHGTKPEGEALSLELPDPNDKEAVIEFVAELYRVACVNYQNTENVAYMVKSSTLMLNMIDVPGYRFCVKNGDEFRYLEYSFIDDADNPMIALISAIMGTVAGDSTQFALAQYTDSTMDTMVARRVVLNKNAEYISRTENEDGSIDFNVDWSSVAETEVDKPVYYAGQSERFQHTDHTVNAQTITEAKVTYNAEEGYYICEFTLDPDLAPLERTLPSLKANSEREDAHYTELKQVMHIWDNGYFKYYNAVDKWEASNGAVTSTIDFHTTYYYDEVHTDISNYQYMSEMCHK